MRDYYNKLPPQTFIEIDVCKNGIEEIKEFYCNGRKIEQYKIIYDIPRCITKVKFKIPEIK